MKGIRQSLNHATVSWFDLKKLLIVGMSMRKENFMKLASIIACLTILALPVQASAEIKQAIFAGGCFWCVESDFDYVEGVISTTSGYIGGQLKNPTYADVTSETSGHREAVRIEYDSTKTDYAKLLDVYWHSTDPTDSAGQFCDKGESYTPAIFVKTPEERAIAERTKTEIGEKLKQKVATLVLDAAEFWPAEDYHQDFYKKSSVRYSYYRNACGRDERIKSLFGADAHRGIEKH
jgi:peptide-methionine (S)-S-oxide reductase